MSHANLLTELLGDEGLSIDRQDLTVERGRIVVGKRLRAVNEAHVDSLAKSITNFGLLHRITLVATNGTGGELHLAAGRHRLAAHDKRNIPWIPAVVFNLSHLPEALREPVRISIEVHENLGNNGLTTSESSMAIEAAVDAEAKIKEEVKKMRDQEKLAQVEKNKRLAEEMAQRKRDLEAVQKLRAQEAVRRQAEAERKAEEERKQLAAWKDREARKAKEKEIAERLRVEAEAVRVEQEALAKAKAEREAATKANHDAGRALFNANKAVERSACETPDASGQSQAEIPHGVLKPTQQAIADRHGLASRTVAQKYSIAKALPEGMLDAISDIEGCSLDSVAELEALARICRGEFHPGRNDESRVKQGIQHAWSLVRRSKEQRCSAVAYIDGFKGEAAADAREARFAHFRDAGPNDRDAAQTLADELERASAVFNNLADYMADSRRRDLVDVERRKSVEERKAKREAAGRVATPEEIASEERPPYHTQWPRNGEFAWIESMRVQLNREKAALHARIAQLKPVNAKGK